MVAPGIGVETTFMGIKSSKKSRKIKDSMLGIVKIKMCTRKQIKIFIFNKRGISQIS